MKIKDNFITGRKPILDLVQSDEHVERVWLDKQVRGEFEKELRFFCRQKGVHLQAVPKQKLNELVKSSTHQGVVALISPIQFYAVEDILQHSYDRGVSAKFLALDGIEDTRNLGALARTALWFGFDALIVPIKGTAGIHAGTLKSSAGALMQIKVCKSPQLSKSLELLKNSGSYIIGTDGSGEPLQNVKIPDQPFTIIMGNEEKGMSVASRKQCDSIVSISGSGAFESLNVSVAAGIILHHFFEPMAD